MSKGALPVPHIIAILLGIIVVALLGYWFYTTGGSFSGAASETACRGKLLQYCTFWSGNGYKDKPIGFTEGFYVVNKDCEAHKSKIGEDTKDTCQKLLRQQ